MPRRRPTRPGTLADLSPFRIARQIVTLQLLYYVTAVVIITFAAITAGKPMNADRLLAWRNLNGGNTEGWMFALCWMLTSLACVIYLLLLIARSKLILDFALTIHLVNLILSSLYSKSVPTFPFWWLTQASSAALMTFLGIWSCRWRELQPIHFGGTAAPDDASVEHGPNGFPDPEGFEYSRGSKHGKRRDGAGAYEMVPVKETNRAV